MAAIKGALTEAGLLAFVVENRIHVVPPCTITAEQVAQGLAIFDAVFARFASPGEVGEGAGYCCRAARLHGPTGCEPVSGSCRPGKAQPPPGEIKDTVPDILPGGAALAGPTGVSL